MTTTEDQDIPQFDPEQLRAKYRSERDKRLRADGNEQFLNWSTTSPPRTTPGSRRTSSGSSRMAAMRFHPLAECGTSLNTYPMMRSGKMSNVKR